MENKEKLNVISFVKLATFLVLIGLGALFFYYDLQKYLSLEYIHTHSPHFIENYETHPIKTAFIFSFIYILAVIFSLPGTVVFMLLSGTLFPIWLGIVLSLICSGIGAVLAVIITRFIYQDTIREKFPRFHHMITKKIEKEYEIYLFSLRLIPIFPFFITNYLFSITHIPITNFFLVTILGMLPTTILYVNAGKNLMNIHSLWEVVDFSTLLMFSFLGALLIFLRHWQKWQKKIDKKS